MIKIEILIWMESNLGGLNPTQRNICNERMVKVGGIFFAREEQQLGGN